MLFRLEFEIKYLNGTSQVVATRPATDVAFERQFGVSVASMFSSMPPDVMADGKVDQVAALRWFGDLKQEHQCFLAWHSSKATVPFDDWIETVDAVNWKFAASVDPTQPVPPATSSAPSLP